MSGKRPAVSFAAFGTSKGITLECGDGVALTAEPKSFYIAIPVQEYTKGYRFDIRTDREGAHAVVLKAKSGGVTPAANTIYGTLQKRLLRRTSSTSSPTPTSENGCRPTVG